MLVIPIQPVPSQQVLCVLDGQNCQIAIYLKNDRIFVDLNSNGVNLCLASLAHNADPLDACNSYDGFQGNLYFIDTQGEEDPQYTGFSSRWFLVYLSASEVLLTETLPTAVLNSVPILTLSATLDVTAPSAGNFSWAHGLHAVPFLIEIVPTAAGAIWGQAGFADDTDLFLVASDVGMAATVYVYTVAAEGLAVQSPAATILASATEAGPFVVAHGLGSVPELIEILPTSGGAIWESAPADGTNVYLSASDAATATLTLFGPVGGAFNLTGPATILTVTSSAPGEFPWPHGLPQTPSRIQILMISGGSIWAQTPAFDANNVNLNTSDAGVIAKISVYE